MMYQGTCEVHFTKDLHSLCLLWILCCLPFGHEINSVGFRQFSISGCLCISHMENVHGQQKRKNCEPRACTEHLIIDFLFILFYFCRLLWKFVFWHKVEGVTFQLRYFILKVFIGWLFKYGIWSLVPLNLYGFGVFKSHRF